MFLIVQPTVLRTVLSCKVCIRPAPIILYLVLPTLELYVRNKMGFAPLVFCFFGVLCAVLMLM